MPDQSFTEKITRWRVRAALLGIALVIILARPSWLFILIGEGVCAVGLLIRAWACGYIQKEKKLTTSGPYRYSRNPLYVGNLVLGISIAVGARSWWVLALFGIYFLAFYPVVIARERRKMESLFPEEYKDYARKVPAFFPRLTPAASVDETRFSWERYRKNREYRALIGCISFWLILAAKVSL